jgi:hypothetical protein
MSTTPAAEGTMLQLAHLTDAELLEVRAQARLDDDDEGMLEVCGAEHNIRVALAASELVNG